MKFLCTECDTAMKFKDVMRPEQGSVTALFECPDCFAEIAMFLNPWETQMLKSLDLKLGGNTETAAPMQMVRSQLETGKAGALATAAGTGTAATSDGSAEAAGKCPFTGVISEAFQETPEVPERNVAEVAETGTAAGEDAEAAGKCPFTGVISDTLEETSEPPEPKEPSAPVWTAEALERLERIPSFVRPMAKMGIESFAKENGHAEITGEVMDSARGNFPTPF